MRLGLALCGVCGRVWARCVGLQLQRQAHMVQPHPLLSSTVHSGLSSGVLLACTHLADWHAGSVPSSGAPAIMELGLRRFTHVSSEHYGTPNVRLLETIFESHIYIVEMCDLAQPARVVTCCSSLGSGECQVLVNHANQQ